MPVLNPPSGERWSHNLACLLVGRDGFACNCALQAFSDLVIGRCSSGARLFHIAHIRLCLTSRLSYFCLATSSLVYGVTMLYQCETVREVSD